jgi:hypothetical protein
MSERAALRKRNISRDIKDLHRHTIRDGDNKSGTHASFGSRREGICSPAPTYTNQMRGQFSWHDPTGTDDSHNKREQTIIPTHNKKKREIRSTHTFLDRTRQNDVPNKRGRAREHDVPSPFTRAIAVPCLEKDHKPSYNVRRDCQPLRVDRRES